MDALAFLRTALISTTLTPACASGVTSQRYVDEPAGMSHEFGTPQNTTYSAEVEAERDILRLIVFKQAECERIRVRIVSRTEETIQDGEVINREPVGPVQVADGSDGMVICDQGYARDVRVSLRVGTATHLLGHTSPLGELTVNLSSELKQSLYGEAAPAEATLLVEGQPTAQLSLAELKKHEARTTELVSEFETMLQKEQTEWTPEELARSYVLFAQLEQLDRGDARIAGLLTRFLEMAYGRKQLDATKNLKRNLEALKTAKDLLATAAKDVPMFVQIAIQDGSMSAGALRWAQGQVLLGVRARPSICSSEPTWATINQVAWAPQEQVSWAYLRYVHDNAFLQDVKSLCTTVVR